MSLVFIFFFFFLYRLIGLGSLKIEPKIVFSRNWIIEGMLLGKDVQGKQEKKFNENVVSTEFIPPWSINDSTEFIPPWGNGVYLLHPLGSQSRAVGWGWVVLISPIKLPFHQFELCKKITHCYMATTWL